MPVLETPPETAVAPASQVTAHGRALRVMGLLEPNHVLSKRVFWMLALSWVGIFLFLGWASHLAILPSLLEIVQAFPTLWKSEGLGQEFYISLVLNLEAVILMTVVSLLIAYLTVVPAARPLGMWAAFARFNGMVGLPLIFTLLFGNVHQVKVALLVYGMATFSIPSIQKMIESIPTEAFDHARTLRMNEWRVTWEVVILGRFDEVIEILRTNAAFGWVMLPMVEGMFEYEGGIGRLVVIENKHFHLAAVYCIVILVGLCGLGQDYLFGVVKRVICPYSLLGVEKR